MNQNLLIPGAIVIAGALIAGGLLMRNGGEGTDIAHNVNSRAHVSQNTSVQREENPYVFGNPDAPVTVVEFSDFECPFCARLHPTLTRIVEESDGGINWEYRHFPLSIHRNAESAAAAGECIGRLSGNDAFWEFADVAFQNQRSLGTALYESEAERLGVSLDAFRACMGSSEISDVIRGDFNAAVGNGGRGTPFAVIVHEDGSLMPFSGALPYEQLVQLVNSHQ